MENAPWFLLGVLTWAGVVGLYVSFKGWIERKEDELNRKIKETVMKMVEDKLERTFMDRAIGATKILIREHQYNMHKPTKGEWE